MPRDLFADDEEESKPDKVVTRKESPAVPKANASTTIRVNESYATKYDQVKRKQELQRLSSKYGSVQGTGDSDDEEGDEDDESDDDEEEGSEDDDARFLTDDNELQFAKLFHKIRTDPDEVARDKQTRYFAPIDADTQPQQKKEFRLKDEYQRRLNTLAAGAEDGIDDEESAAPPPEERSRKLKPRTQEEKQLRDAFLAATKATVEDFDVTLVSRGPKPAPRETKAQSTNLLHDAFRAAGATEDEKFLEKFFVDQLWRKDGTDGDSGSEYDWEAAAKEEADEIFYDEAERWEKEFQERMYRHEDGDVALTVQTFPRVLEGQLRRKSSSRKETRERREARKNEEMNRQVEELKRLKTLKRKEIEEQRALIARVAGIKNLAKVGITREFLEKDFDPAEFDKAMSAMFDHDYDNGVDDDEVGLFADENDDVPDVEHAGSVVDPDEAAAAADSNVDASIFGDTLEDSVAAARPLRQVHEKQQQRFLADDDLALLYPDEALRELEDLAPTGIPSNVKCSAAVESGGGDLKRGLDEKVSEYWKLHYHKIAGDVRTRFRYREVNPETFGLTDEDVLTKDDRQLNMIAPMNCYAAFLGANENKKDRYKALHRRKTLREISSERTSRKYGNVQSTAILNADLPEEEGQQVAARIVEGTKRLRGHETSDAVDTAPHHQAAHKGRRTEGPHTATSPQQNPEHRAVAAKGAKAALEHSHPRRGAAGHRTPKERTGAQ